MTMKILVDYDNVPIATSRQGLAYLADLILTKVSPFLSEVATVDFRLYGGWYRNSRMTQCGQEISVQMRAKFPWSLRIDQRPVVMTMQLAQSLEALPRKTLLNTLREEPFRKMKCQTPSRTTCRNDSCPIDPMALFLNTGKCPSPGCDVEPKMLLSRSEQKLVDTMIVADIIHLASNGESPIGIVSSDDDMWPGILCALNLGASIIHLQTATLNARSIYLTETSGNYVPIGL
jgi:hypothetical protein